MKRTYVKSGKYTRRAKAQRLRRKLEKAAPVVQQISLEKALLLALASWWRDNGPSASIAAFGFWAQIDLGTWRLLPNYRKGIYAGHVLEWLCFSARHPW